jgi:MFS family permease
MASLSPAETVAPQLSADRWTAHSLTVWAICMLGFAFDIYEATIMQLVTPLLIKEWGITPATMGYITTVSRWVGLIGVFVFPTLADLYGRRPILILTILSYSLFTGFTGFAQGPRCSCCCSPRSHASRCRARRRSGRSWSAKPLRQNGAPQHSADSSAAIRSATCCAR